EHDILDEPAEQTAAAIEAIDEDLTCDLMRETGLREGTGQGERLPDADRRPARRVGESGRQDEEVAPPEPLGKGHALPSSLGRDRSRSAQGASNFVPGVAMSFGNTETQRPFCTWRISCWSTPLVWLSPLKSRLPASVSTEFFSSQSASFA